MFHNVQLVNMLMMENVLNAKKTVLLALVIQFVLAVCQNKFYKILLAKKNVTKDSMRIMIFVKLVIQLVIAALDQLSKNALVV